MGSKNVMEISAVDGSASSSAGSSSLGLLGISPDDALLLNTHSLTIREDRLSVTDKRKPNKSRNASCCGIDGQSTKNSSSEEIKLHNVLWCQVSISESQSAVRITYAKEFGNRLVKPKVISIPIDEGDLDKADIWVERLLTRAYDGSQQAKRLKVLVNPNGGPGTAEKIYKTEIEPILKAACCTIDMQMTEYSKHAIKIAQELDIDAYDAVICVSGDGVPHEVFNGLGKRPDARKALRKIAVCQLPGGSGNGMCWNYTGTDAPSLAAIGVVKGKRMPFDLVSVTQGNERMLSFLSQAVGLTAELDLGTENMRWMGGTRFIVGFLQRMITEKAYPCEVHVKLAIDNKEDIRRQAAIVRDPPSLDDEESEDQGLPPLEYGTIQDEVPDDWLLELHPKMGTFYVGNMNCMSKDIYFFPAAKPNDGYIDMVNADADVGRMVSVSVMTGAETGKHFDIPQLKYRKVLAYRFTPKNQKDGYISIDGEKVAFAPFQAEIHRGLGTALSLRQNMYEGPTI